MSDSAQLLARILMSIVFIIFGYLQFTNIAGYAANPSVLKAVALTGADPIAPYGGAAVHDSKVWIRRAA